MKNTLVHSDFNEETGISTVTIGNRYGTFTATCKVSEEDLPTVSKFAGCRFAEIKATIKAYKKALKNINIEIGSFENFFSSLISSNKYNSKSYEARQAKNYRKALQAHKAEIEEIIADYEKVLDKSIKDRDLYFQNKSEGNKTLDDDIRKKDSYFMDKEGNS